MFNQNNMSKPRYLIASDFDGTLFDTSKPSPSGMTVETAYTQSLDDLFGEGFGKLFFSINGFNGESPSQIVQGVLNMQDKRLVHNAKQMHEDHNGNFPTIIPESQNGTIPWNDENPQTALTSMLVIEKLGYLLQEIGTHDQLDDPWPLPCEGALDFLKTLKDLRERGAPIDFAIISSGHESFIKKTLGIWNIPLPDILVTEDSVRTRAFPQEAERKFKPGVLPVALAHFQWLKNQGILASRENGYDTRTRIMHIGDNPTKDLVMASKAGVKSNFLYPTTPWVSIINALRTNRDLLDGRPFDEIFAQRKDMEAYARSGRTEIG